MEQRHFTIMSKYVKSREALPSNLHLWESAPTQTVIAETKTVHFCPTSSIESSDTVSFAITLMQKYILDKVEVVTEIRVLTADGDIPEENNNVSTAPHLAAILWRNVDINISGQSLSQSFDNPYSMFKFWDTVLHNREGTHPILRQKGFLLDWVYSKKDSENTTYYPTQGEAVNKNGKIRADRIKLGRKVCLVSTLNIPLFTLDKLLPPGLEITVNLTKKL